MELTVRTVLTGISIPRRERALEFEMRNRDGFTIVELLVVIAIIGLLVALLLPAIQTARESARRTSCANNLRQVSIALLTFDTTHGKLPAGSRIASDGFLAWGMLASALPFLEEGNRYSSIDFDASPCASIRKLQAANENDPTSRPVSEFICPSDSKGNLPLFSGPPGASYPCGKLYPTNYLGMAGSNDDNITGTYSGCASQILRGNGVFFSNSEIRSRNLKDGASRTIMIGERGIPENLGWGWPIAGGTECEHYVSSKLGIFKGNYNPAEYFIHNQHYWSWHPGGINVAFAGGAVRFLEYEIDYKVYEALTTRGGGESVVFP